MGFIIFKATKTIPFVAFRAYAKIVNYRWGLYIFRYQHTEITLTQEK